MKPSEEYNLKILYPELASEWHPLKNGDLSPDKVAPFSSKKVWWRCGYGHEWQANIGSRARGYGCPYCYGRYPTEDYNLRVIKPGLASQWHPTRNNDLTPDKVAPHSSKRVWWMCEEGHEWPSPICDRHKHGCPVCALQENRGKKRAVTTLLDAHPALAEQWHPRKNGDFKPSDVSPGSKRKVWWICGEGHAWKTTVKKRVKGSGCPYCTGHKPSKENNLQAVLPEIAKQWHPTKNGKLTPRKVTPGSKKKVWWMCEKRHEWEAAILNRKYGNKCPYCVGKRASKEYNLAVLHPEIAKQWHPDKNGTLTPEQVTPSSNLKVWWKCENGHEWFTKVGNRSKMGGRGCPYCAGKRKIPSDIDK